MSYLIFNNSLFQQTELDRTKTKIGKLTEDFEKDKVELERTKDVEISDLRKQLSANAEELEKQELQTQAHKQVLDQITMEREAMKVSTVTMETMKVGSS